MFLLIGAMSGFFVFRHFVPGGGDHGDRGANLHPFDRYNREDGADDGGGVHQMDQRPGEDGEHHQDFPDFHYNPGDGRDSKHKGEEEREKILVGTKRS